MEIALIIKAVLTLIFVLGLLFLTVWGLKYCELKSANNRIFNKIRVKRRLEIIENSRIDLRNSLVLIRRDNTEHLLLLSPSGNTLIESRTVAIEEKKEAAND
ncbi:MAG: hypothetical protein IJX20_00955 [Alphaproteobacteria bacterium]|nr:hypothetical protein [Alphaproteobacteria bacterium]